MLKIEKVNENNFKEIPDSCRRCLYWQTEATFGEEMLKPEMERQKSEWLVHVNDDFGNCVKLAYLDNVPIGFVQYAPAKFFPKVKEYASGPPSQDAVFLACLYITSKEQRGKGFGSAILEDLLAELKKRREKAVETFARKNSADNPSGPLSFYLKHNFKIKSERDDFPLVRLELL